MNDKCSNGFREFDSHTTTKIINMKVKYVSDKWIVMTNYSQQIMFCHDSKSKCYEWIFNKVNYA